MRVYQKEALSVDIKLTAETSSNCGVVFGMTEEFEERRRHTGEPFCCPNGHHLHYTKNLQGLEEERPEIADAPGWRILR